MGVSAESDNRYFVNTDGTQIEHGRDFARVVISASAKAKDGMDVSDFRTFEAADPKDLPSNEVIEAAIKQVGEHVEALTTAPAAVSPSWDRRFSPGALQACFSTRSLDTAWKATGKKDESEGQTFTKSVGDKILPDFLSVTFDPTLKQIAKRN